MEALAMTTERETTARKTTRETETDPQWTAVPARRAAEHDGTGRPDGPAGLRLPRRAPGRAGDAGDARRAAGRQPVPPAAHVQAGHRRQSQGVRQRPPGGAAQGAPPEGGRRG